MQSSKDSSSKRKSMIMTLIEGTSTKTGREKVSGSIHLMMVRNTVVNTSEVNAMVWEKQSTLTAISTGDSTKIISKKAMGHTTGSQMARNTLVSGKMIRDMAMACTDGLMEQHITGNIMRVNGRDTVSVSIQTRMNTTDNGRTKSILEKEHTHMLQLVKSRELFGKTARKYKSSKRT